MESFVKRPRHPLAEGVLIACEELGVNVFPEGARWRYLAIIDSLDDSVQGKAGTAGTVIVSFYEQSVGIVAVAACDLVKRTILSRGLGGATQAIKLGAYDAQAGAGSGEPSSVPLFRSRRTKLHGAVVNMYLGKAERVPLSLAAAPELFREKFSLTSYGGGRGALLCSEGSVDATIEIAKGFKVLETACCFLADGAGAVVQNLDGTPFNFGPDMRLEAIFDGPQSGWAAALDAYRLKFLIACTPELAEDIRGRLAPGSR
jgi:hypothetical protein